MKKLSLFIVALSFLLLFCHGCKDNYEIPKFKITWHGGGCFNILFDQKLSDNEIENIIYVFREIRKNNDFPKYFPPPLSNPEDKYADIQILIFTDPKWATEEMCRDRFIGKMSKKIEKQYFNSMRGYYSLHKYWYKYRNSDEGFEYGTLGHSDGDLKSDNFKQLFKIGGK